MKNLIFLLLVSFGTLGQESKFLFADSTDLYQKFNFPEAEKIREVLSNSQNKELLKSFFDKFSESFNSEKQYQTLLNTNVDEWEMNLFDTRNQQLLFIKSPEFLKSPYLVKHLETEIKYNYWHLLFAYPVLRSNLDTKMKRVVSLPSVMTKGFKFVKNDSLLHFKSFRAMLPFYLTYKNSEEKDFVKYSDMVKSTIDKSEFAIKTMNGITLDYILGVLLSANQKYLTPGPTRYIISQIENTNLQKEFKGPFLDKIIESEKVANLKAKEEAIKPKSSKGKASYSPHLTDLTDKIFDFSKYKGKVVYVDFWASWCGPCRKEFPFSRKMHESLSEKEKEKIVFLYISIDDLAETWKNAVKTLELGDFEHGFSPGGWGSEVVQKFNITGIPRYMILNKAGEIVENDAKRPSNPETISDLLELAK